jgi:hypothetical protein
MQWLAAGQFRPLTEAERRAREQAEWRHALKVNQPAAPAKVDA